MIKVINLSEKLAQINDHWNPRVVGELNNQQVKLVKIQGEFVMHKHEHEDELFMVIDGLLKMEIESAEGVEQQEVKPGEFIIIPRGVNHRPIAPEEVQMLLFEPATTLNTGDQENEMTRRELEKL